MARKNPDKDSASPDHEGGRRSSGAGSSAQRNLDAHEHERDVLKHNTFDDQAFLEDYRSQLRDRRARTGGVLERPADRDRGLASLPPAGSLLHLSTGEVAVFDRDVPSKNYQLVYMLESDGSAKPEGVFLLQAYEFEPIGRLPQSELDHLRDTRLWYRDPVVFYLSEMKFAALVPVPPQNHIVKPGGQAPARPAHPSKAPATAQTREIAREASPQSEEAPPTRREAQEGPPGPAGLHRGQKFRIQFDKNKVWEAVYWGEDEQGTVVAHQTGGNWSFMHLDLKRFASTLAPLEETLTEKEQYDLAESVKPGA